MQKINFVNNSSPDLDADTLNQLQTNIETGIEGTVLYNNSNGTTEDFTLSERASNYKKLGIVIGRSTGSMNTIVYFDLTAGHSIVPIGFIDNDGTTTTIYHARLTISGTGVHITGNINSITIGASSVSTSTRQLAIYKVIGYK